MRATATSRTNSPANIPASQAKADANKADAASPFALLVEMASAKDPARPARKDAKDSGDQPANDKPAIKQNDGNRNGVKQDDNARAAQTAPQPRSAASVKPGKPDTNKDDEAGEAVETVQSAPDDQQIAAIAQQVQIVDQQVLPPAPVVQASIATPAGTDADVAEDIQIDGTAPVAKTATPPSGMDVPQPDPLNGKSEAGEAAQTQAAPQPDPLTGKPESGETAQTQAVPPTQAPAQPDLAEDSEKPGTMVAAPAAAQTAPTDAKPAPKETGKPAAVRTASRNESLGTAKPESDGVERAKNDQAPTDSIQDGNEPVRQAKTVQTDTARDDDPNTVFLKGHAAHNGVANGNAAKTDTDTSGSQKTDAPQADPPPADIEAAAAPAAAKPVPQSASQSNAGFAINTIAAPQAAQHSQAPIATLHVQVTAQAAPNLPALAVEIAAKSQSGAKQFDIRLDPPELGRVEIRLSIDSTGKASAHLSADQPQTLALLQKDAPTLTRALREAGLDVSQDGLNFSLRHQSSGQGGNDSNNGRFGSSRAFSLAATASIDPAATAIAYRGVVDGRLDIRV